MLKKLLFVALLVLSGSLAEAQTTAPTVPALPLPPTFHFVAGGSAINFSGPQGSNVGSIAYTGVQLTTNVSVTYEHLTVPALSARYELGVASYTRGLDSLLGKTFSKKLLFDPSNINVTFQGGAGKLLAPRGNHIAETVGVSLSYPIPGTSAAIQVLGYQYVHAPNVWGTVQKNYTQQMATGIIVYF